MRFLCSPAHAAHFKQLSASNALCSAVDTAVAAVDAAAAVAAATLSQLSIHIVCPHGLCPTLCLPTQHKRQRNRDAANKQRVHNYRRVFVCVLILSDSEIDCRTRKVCVDGQSLFGPIDSVPIYLLPINICTTCLAALCRRRWCSIETSDGPATVVGSRKCIGNICTMMNVCTIGHDIIRALVTTRTTHTTDIRNVQGYLENAQNYTNFTTNFRVENTSAASCQLDEQHLRLVTAPAAHNRCWKTCCWCWFEYWKKDRT